MKEHVVIIGNGISGITAARHIRKQSDCRITIISGETEHFFSRTALMYIFMGHMRYEDTKPYEDDFWQKNRLELLFDWVTSIDLNEKCLHLKAKGTIQYDKLIIATGSSTKHLNVPGSDLRGVQGLYSFQDLMQLEATVTKGVKSAVVVGGGLIGVELAEMLHSRNIKVTMLVRDDRFWGSTLSKQDGNLVTDHIRKQGIDMRLETELKSIAGNKEGVVSGVITSSGEEIPCDLVGMTIGVQPNVGFLRDSGLHINKGVVVNAFLETNMPDVYAIGDCAELAAPSPGRKNIEQVWYTGRMMGETVANTITGKKTPYQPGIWFNSAKFFDLEYHTYGHVPAELPEGQTLFHWKDDQRERALTFAFDAQTRTLKGMNAFGIRLRHELMDAWIAGEKTMEFVMEHLRDANFDPELYRSFEQDVVNAFNDQYKTSVKPKKKDWGIILGKNRA